MKDNGDLRTNRQKNAKWHYCGSGIPDPGFDFPSRIQGRIRIRNTAKWEVGNSSGEKTGQNIENREKKEKRGKEQSISTSLVSTRRGFFCVPGYLAYSATLREIYEKNGKMI